MPALHARPTDHPAISVIGVNANPPLRYLHPDFLRAVPKRDEYGAGGDKSVQQLVTAHPALGSLSEEDRGALLRYSKIRYLKRREIAHRQGDLAGNVILLLDGYLKQSVDLHDGNEVLLNIVCPGDCTGEVAVLQEWPHDSNVTALSRCRLLMIDARQFRQVFSGRPEGLLAIIRAAARRLEIATEQLLDDRALSSTARIAKALLYLASIFSSDQTEPVSHGLRLSQSEIGAMAGVCREVVNKTLGAWRDAGWIEMVAGTVTSVNAPAVSGVSRHDVREGADRMFA